MNDVSTAEPCAVVMLIILGTTVIFRAEKK